MNTSLTKFCKDTGLAKTTVYRRCQELQWDVADGLTPTMCDRLRHEFDIQPEPEPEAEPPVMPTVTMVPEGFVTHSTLAPTQMLDLALPEGFDPAVMVRHFDGVMGQTVDSDQVVAIATIATSAAKKAMDEKVAAQEQALKKTQADKKKLESLIQGTVVDLKVAALKSQLLASQQTTTTSDLQEMLAQLLDLGKPQENPTGPLSSS
ncbi:hypothetical protein NDI52_28960 [Leptolyngbya sp. PL-A3]|uniref:hypothetical protein n=1 Tax=Leptolyngbya sp. PL-A3 TaxID=2933911 RepID=UPI003298C67F